MSTTFSRVRLAGAGLDPVRARLRLESALGACELRPPGLGPSGLLLVRRLSAPAGVTLPLDGGGMRPPPEWEAALVGALEAALRSAARPAREAVPAGAEAVFFADRAELLACLARDARDGTVWGRWWWRSAVASAGARDPAHHAWLEEPHHVPAALAVLAEAGVAAEVIEQVFPESVAAALVAAVRSAFAVPSDIAAPLAAVNPERGHREADASPLEDAPAPWQAVVPEAAAPALGVEQRQLLGVALTLRRAPALARSLAFAHALRTWHTAATRPAAPGPPSVPRPAGARETEPAERGPVPEPAVEVAGVSAPAAPATVPAAAPHGTRRRADAAVSEPSRAARADPRAGDARSRAEETRDSIRPRPPVPDERSVPELVKPAVTAAPRARPTEAHIAPGASIAARATRRAAAALVPDRVDEPRAPTPSPAPVAPAAPIDADALARPVDTRLGGLFYLLNLALFLDLYGDFTQPGNPGLSLDPWDLVTLLGRSLLGEAPADPVWPLLAGLAGREEAEAPGRTFMPPRAWRTPRAWLAPFDPAGTWRWSAARGVLRIEHPAGFPVAAVPRRGELAVQLRRELQRLGRTAAPAAPASPGPATAASPGAAIAATPPATAASPGPAAALTRTSLPREPADPLARWVARLAAYSHARLLSALRVDDVAATLLQRDARVYVTPAHVDVVFALAEHPIEIRFAGLDRTPGFIPATGRTVALYFE